MRYLALIVALALAVPAAPPAHAQTNQNQLLPWAEQFVVVQQHIAAATDAMTGMAALFRAARSREDLLAATQTLSPRLVDARARLTQARTVLDGMGALNTDAAAAQFSASVVTDTRNLVQELDALFAAVQGLEAAIVANDSNRVMQIAERVISGAILLVRNQANVIRARQAAFPASESDHHILGSVASMYSSMVVIMTARTATDAAQIRVNADEMARWNASARQTLAQERQGLSRLSGDARALETRYLDLNEQQVGMLEGAAATVRGAADSITGAVTREQVMALARPLAEYDRQLQESMMQQSQLTLESLR